MIVSIKFSVVFFFFFNDTATPEIYTLSLHDALPICIADQFPPAADIGGTLRCGAGISTVVLLSVDHHVPAPGGQVSVECAAVVRYGADAAASPQREGARQGGRSHRIVLKCQDIGG